MPLTSDAERLRLLRTEYDLLRALIEHARLTGNLPDDDRIAEIINRSSTLRAEIDELEQLQR